MTASVVELLVAWKRRELPAGLYEATRFVPFPHASAPTLVQKFPADMPDATLDKLWNAVGWYAKIPWISGLEKKQIRDLFQALPQIMAEFRAHVARAADADPEIAARTAPNYIAAYRGIA